MKLIGATSKGEEVHQITLRKGDLTVTLLTLGAIVQDVRLRDVDYGLTLGSDSIADYETTMVHHGSLIGPVANRISTARVRLDGMVYELERNQDGRIHLHSGAEATHRRVWSEADISDDSATLTIAMPDGMCGLPGNRQVTAKFSISGQSTLTLLVEGTTDSTTLMNFANHSYWNLDGSDSYAGHTLWIDADHYLPSTEDDYPTGEIADVTGTAMDFRTPRGAQPHKPPFDNNFCLSDGEVALRDVLKLTGQSGVAMTVATTCPGIQVYDSRNAQRPGKATYEGLAIEAQHWPDAPNHRGFPSIKVSANAPYRQTTSWTFSR